MRANSSLPLLPVRKQSKNSLNDIRIGLGKMCLYICTMAPRTMTLVTGMVHKHKCIFFILLRFPPLNFSNGAITDNIKPDGALRPRTIDRSKM